MDLNQGAVGPDKPKPYFSTWSDPQQYGVEHMLFGFRVPWLPDFLSDRSIVGVSEVERIGYVMQRWVEFVDNLWGWNGAAFSLRFLSQPGQGVEIAVLVRVSAQAGRTSQLGEAMADDLERLLAQLKVPVTPLLSREGESGLLRYQALLDNNPYLLEVRQHEELTILQVGNGSDAYVVHPYWSATGAWHTPMAALKRQSAPVLVSIYLEPTKLTPSENDMLLGGAASGRQFADVQWTLPSGATYQLRDPQAGLVGRIYEANHMRLTKPFLLIAQVASPDEHAARAVANALGSSATIRPPVSEREKESALPSAFDLVHPEYAQEVNAYWQTLTELRFADWRSTLAGPDQHRLRFLADASGAAAMFRLPVALRSGVPGFPTRQVVPVTEVGARRPTANADEILLGEFEDGGAVTIPVQDLTRHALVAGNTRSGKTNSCLNLLDQLWRVHDTPFLVIEPVKTEYRGLIAQPDFKELLVFTLGNEAVSPFRLNPFELLPDISLEEHIGALSTCFEAAFPQFGVLPIIIEKVIHQVYKDLGWRLTERGSATPDKAFPTLQKVHDAVAKELETYEGEIKGNLQAATQNRIGSLTIGSKGKMFNTQRSMPLKEWMERPVILEMNSLGEEQQPLAMMFVLMMVREYRRTNAQRKIQHVTSVEEAHLAMSKVAPVADREVSPNAAGAGSKMFERMLAEVAGLGEGVLIVEQSPSQLVSGAINNTNLKIAHQLVGPHERKTMGGAMIMDELQEEHLARLRPGHAAIFKDGDENPTFMIAPHYKKDHGFNDYLPDAQVARHMQGFYAQHPEVVTWFKGCPFCTSRCRYRYDILPITHDRVLRDEYSETRVAVATDADRPAIEQRGDKQRWAAAAGSAAARAGFPGILDAAWCYAVQQDDEAYDLTQLDRDKFVAAFTAVSKRGQPGA
jgi:hypothetical protein